MATNTCLCGHDETVHDPACNEPTNRCECDAYAELCPACRHAKAAHDAPNGACTRIKRDTRQPCGCGNYPPETA